MKSEKSVAGAEPRKHKKDEIKTLTPNEVFNV